MILTTNRGIAQLGRDLRGHDRRGRDPRPPPAPRDRPANRRGQLPHARPPRPPAAAAASRRGRAGDKAVSAVSGAGASAHAPGLAPAGPHDRAVPAHARQLAARLSALFERDVEIVKRLNDAQHRLAGRQRTALVRTRARRVRLLYDGAAAAAIGTSPIAALIRDGGPTANSPMLEALQHVRWTIHRAFCVYQLACEQRRQLAVEVGELSQQLTAGALRRRLERAGGAAGQRARSPEWRPERRRGGRRPLAVPAGRRHTPRRTLPAQAVVEEYSFALQHRPRRQRAGLSQPRRRSF